MEHISVDEAAQRIGVSSATIRNWVKAGHLTPVSKHPISFLAESLFNLKSQIGSDSFERLKTRANKVGATNHFLPLESLNNPQFVSHLSDILIRFKADELEIEPFLFLATLRLLEEKDEVKKTKNERLFDLDNYFLWRRNSVKNLIYYWRKALGNIRNENHYCNVYHSLFFCGEKDDFLGLLYQSISKEGSKSQQGAYYTPSSLVEDSLSQMKGMVENFLDPCCGTGKYLILAAKKFNLHPEKVFGFDCDPVAVNIAYINLLLAYKEKDFVPKIFCRDSLSELATGEIFCDTNFLIGTIDAIATNPPWGAYKNSSIANQNPFYGKIYSAETFSMFLAKSIQLLRKGGQLSFLLPESILKIKLHSDIRLFVLNETKISKISMLGRQFTGVFTPVIRLDLIKDTESNKGLVSIEEAHQTRAIPQEQFKKNGNFIFNVETNPEEEMVLNKIYSTNHLTLHKNAEWALGIVTGNNKKYVLEKKEQGAEAIFRGRDVHSFYLGEPTSFIHFIPDHFQQIASEKYFRAREKLIYKFISKKLVFAYDNKQSLTLNSANILIPLFPQISTKVVLAFLNSILFQYVFQKKFSTHKILRGDLEKLPFPLMNSNTQNIIENEVDFAITKKEAPSMELEKLIFSIFGLNEKDISIINQATRSKRSDR
jgi:tRNA1(Val) A37 N6-methylase TrmN6